MLTDGFSSARFIYPLWTLDLVPFDGFSTRACGIDEVWVLLLLGYVSLLLSLPC